jgi:tetratricopeptide (TPR) repeat protein
VKKLLAFILLFTAAAFYAQVKDSDAYKNISAIDSIQLRIPELKNFLTEYPSSSLTPRIYYDLSLSYLTIDQTDSAYYYADKFLNMYPADAQLNALNGIAYQFATMMKGLDTALVYSKRAVQIARNTKSRNVGMYLDTEALILYNLGKYDEALADETEAIKGHENEPEYIANLAQIEAAAGKTREALQDAAKVILFTGSDHYVTEFNEWLNKEAKTDAEKIALKTEIADKVYHDILSELTGSEDKADAKTSAAEMYAKLGIRLDSALAWAKEGVNNLKPNSTADDKVKYHTALGVVYIAKGNEDLALKEFNSIKDYAAPNDFSFWTALGNLYENKKEYKAALDAYVSGLTYQQTPEVRSKAEALLEKLHLTKADLDKKIAEKKKEGSEFKPGEFKGKNNGNVVLAELFTGAECNPCQAADVAFDKLSEYFNRKELAILQFHVHIPGPDPLANTTTYGRYTYYGANFGTPTAIFNGTEKIIGGGPRDFASNRFAVYKDIIANDFSKKNPVSLSGKAEFKDSIVNVNLTVKGDADTAALLYITLAEKSIKYTGSNTIDHHIYVARHTILSKMKDGAASDYFDVAAIQKNIRDYLDHADKFPGWRPGFGAVRWHDRPDTINLKNLCVVAWLQDRNTKQVLNAYYMDVE